jgi:hypothetical protein
MKIMDYESKIIQITREGDFYIINTETWSFGLDRKYKVIPKIGDTVKIYLIQDSNIRGLDINGERVFWKTDEELERERQEWLDNYNKEKQERFEKQKEQMDIDYEALPDEFKKRIDRFRNNNPTFRVDYEEYEVFCCKEALKIAEYCKTPENVKDFYNKSWEEQKKVISDEHSGNTFGAACVLASLYLSNPEMLYKQHGALSPLVGSEEYGDVPKC